MIRQALLAILLMLLARFIFLVIAARLVWSAEDIFEATLVDNLDIASVGTNSGLLQLIECSVACMTGGDTCFAFHRSSSGVCFLLFKATGGWPEKVAAPSLWLWMRGSKQNPNCTAAAFPKLRGRSRYSLETAKRNWNAAESNCVAKGGKLTEIMNANERLFIVDFVKDVPGLSQYLHVGLKQLPGSSEPSGGWVWRSTSEPFDQPWTSGQPNDYKTQDYGGIEPLKSGTFHDLDLGYVVHSVCECMLM